MGLLVTNLSKIITPLGNEPRKGKEMSELLEISQGAIAIEEGKIAGIGKEKEIKETFGNLPILDGKGRVALPGFVDPHTHLVFAGSREKEFVMRIQGKSYVEIAQEGGGIRSTVEAVRRASLEELVESALIRADRLMDFGVTTVEVKSGYGLATEHEIKQLEAIKKLNQLHVMDFIPTFLGAHEVPLEYKDNKGEYLKILLEEMIPEVGRRNLARFCDVFCEAHVYSVEESRVILERAKEYGMTPKLHADEIEPMGGAELAAEVGAISADHLGAISEEGMKRLAESGVIAVLLPSTSFYLRLPHYAPARAMIEKGIPIALATDLNPGSSMTENFPFILTLACLYLGLTPQEALTAATLNAACAIGEGKNCGSLEMGKKADILLVNIPNLEYLPYHYGVNHVDMVLKKGEIVRRNI
ncbi:MAG: imidazolonepropionase [Planctomycetota bacterium]|nr:MAG: imidazolonepropionase [Planctomycetota bacterium]